MKEQQLKRLIKEVLKTMLTEGYETTIKDPATGEDVYVEVEYDYYPSRTGRRHGMDRFAEPDEAATIDITSITAEDGREIDVEDLDDNTLANLESNILDSRGDIDEEKEKPSYYDQRRMAFQKAKREKNVEALAYYATLGDTSANVPFEQFKGSWAYEEWLKKPETQQAIKREQDELKRFSYMNEDAHSPFATKFGKRKDPVGDYLKLMAKMKIDEPPPLKLWKSLVELGQMAVGLYEHPGESGLNESNKQKR